MNSVLSEKDYQKFILDKLKGAGDEVDKFGAKIVNKYGIKKLNDIAKLNLKNTDKIKELSNIK